MKEIHYISIILIFIIQSFLSCDSVNVSNEHISIDTNKSNTLSLESKKEISEKRFPLLVSNDLGESWKPATENLPEDIQVSFIEPKGKKIVLASDNKGIFLSSENKLEWNSIGKQLPGNKINALHIFGPSIYVSVYQKGIYQTSDEGHTWVSLNPSFRNFNVQSILKLEKLLLIGTDQGIFILDNNMNIWRETNIKSQVLSIYEYNNNLIAGTNQGTLISKDKGNHWEWIRKEGAVHYTHHLRQRIVELALNGDLIYSDNWGKTWNSIQYKPRQGSYVYEIIEYGDYQLISNNYGIHRSDDNGKTWKHIFKTESMIFFDLITVEDKIYGGTRVWDEYRKKE